MTRHLVNVLDLSSEQGAGSVQDPFHIYDVNPTAVVELTITAAPIDLEQTANEAIQALAERLVELNEVIARVRDLVENSENGRDLARAILEVIK